jgi:20S proteasome, alpha and beta subunits
MQYSPERFPPFFYGPEGRLIQVEYAAEAVSRGSTTVGIRTDQFAFIASHVRPPRELVDPFDKIFEIDEHVGATGSGYISDMLRLVDELKGRSSATQADYGNADRHLYAFKTNRTFIHEFTLTQ